MKSTSYDLALQLHNDFKNIHHLNTMLPCWFHVHLPINFGPFINFAYKAQIRHTLVFSSPFQMLRKTQFLIYFLKKIIHLGREHLVPKVTV